jgi:hypothetical protein
LEKENEIKLNKLKEDAMGKLKELGNSILGNFGMSLDNFKMAQDPQTGGWNIRFNYHPFVYHLLNHLISMQK